MVEFIHVLQLLREALTDPSRLRTNTPKFQEWISNGKVEFPNKKIENIFGDLAYDLDYYEPNPKSRADDISFFGDEIALDEIRSALTAFDLEVKS